MKKALKKLLSKYDSVVVFDTETTGLDPEKDQVIEVAAMRLKANPKGELIVEESFDTFVKLPERKRIPRKIVELTHINDEMLKNGVSLDTANDMFKHIIRGNSLLVAHNAQFDCSFMKAAIGDQDFLDTLTVFRDRAEYPHKLSAAIEFYGLQEEVVNSHRAIDDVMALTEVLIAMDKERDDLPSYVNIFGFNPKYGVSGKRIDKVKYISQGYWHENRPMPLPMFA